MRQQIPQWKNQQNYFVNIKRSLEYIQRETELKNYRKLHQDCRNGNDGINLKTYSDAVLNIYAFKPKEKYVQQLDDTFDSDEADNSSDSDEDIPSTEQQKQSTESTMTCDICNVSGFAPSGINRHKFYCRKKHLAAV